MDSGLLWGSAGFLAFFVAPGIGLPPEIPGIEAAAIENRQSWWMITTLCVGAGLLILAYAPLKFKVVSVALFALPYLLEVPHHQGPAFTYPDAEAVTALTQLHQQFIVASGATNLVFWLVLGLLCAWVLKNKVLKDIQT